MSIEKDALNTNPLQYEELIFDDSIRILQLKAALDEDADLCACFKEVRLSDAPSYEAISYTWGAPLFPETVYIDSIPVGITENLASALKNFRYKDRERILWADAVCINQKNETEKGKQVARMGEIYRRASHVLIWLGIDSSEERHAIEGFQILADELSTSTTSQKRWHPQILQFERLARRKRGEEDLPEPEPKHFEEDFDSLLDGSSLEGRLPVLTQGQGIPDMLIGRNMDLIYEKPWFYRLWTVQEVALAAKATLFCGKHELDWPRFAAVIALFKSHLLRTRPYIRNSESILRACSIVETRALYQIISSSEQDVSAMQTSRFIRIVETIRSQNCTDDRDRVYALLNLRSSNTFLEIHPDYSKPVWLVYLDYTLKSLEQGNFEILYNAGNWYRESARGSISFSSSEALPSWSPDFRKTSVRDQLPWLRHASEFQSKVWGQYSWETRKSKDGSFPMTIKVGGFVMDTIIEVTGARLPPGQAFAATQKLVRECLELTRKCNAERNYPTGQHVEVAFWNTVAMRGHCVAMDQIIGNRNPPQQGVANLGRLFQKHCLDDQDGEVAKHALVDLWLNTDELDTFNKLSSEAQISAVFYECIRETMDSVGFIITAKGFFGLVPPGTQPGDRIAVIAGATYPFVIRPIPGASFFTLIGTCYIQGLMHGMLYEGTPSMVSLV